MDERSQDDKLEEFKVELMKWLKRAWEQGFATGYATALKDFDGAKNNPAN